MGKVIGHGKISSVGILNFVSYELFSADWLTVKIKMLYLKDFITRLGTTCTVVKFMLRYIPGLLLFPSEIISSKDLGSKRENHLLCFR